MRKFLTHHVDSSIQRWSCRSSTVLLTAITPIGVILRRRSALPGAELSAAGGTDVGRWRTLAGLFRQLSSSSSLSPSHYHVTDADPTTPISRPASLSSRHHARLHKARRFAALRRRFCFRCPGHTDITRRRGGLQSPCRVPYASKLDWWDASREY